MRLFSHNEFFKSFCDKACETKLISNNNGEKLFFLLFHQILYVHHINILAEGFSPNMSSHNVLLILSLSLISSILTYPETYMCSPGWSYNPITGACYGVNRLPPRLSWMGAEEYCKKSGRHLASFQTQEEYEHLLSKKFFSLKKFCKFF